MKKFNIKKAKKDLHKLWSKAIRERDEFVCQWCGKMDKKNHAHHIIPQSRCGNTGKYDISNGITLCYRCHLHRKNAEEHEYVAFIDQWLIEMRLDTYDEMNLNYNECIGVKFTKDFYKEKLAGLNNL